MAVLQTSKPILPAGSGAYALDRLTLGIFLVDQPSHRLSIGADRRMDRRLTRDQGWILPSGSDGLCEYDAPLDLLMARDSRLSYRRACCADFSDMRIEAWRPEDGEANPCDDGG